MKSVQRKDRNHKKYTEIGRLLHITATPVTTKAPETTTAATEPLEWGEEAFSATMYVNQSCYSRIKALMGSEAVKQYTYGEAVNVVAKTDTGYYKLNDGEYIHGDYLSETEL